MIAKLLRFPNPLLLGVISGTTALAFQELYLVCLSNALIIMIALVVEEAYSRWSTAANEECNRILIKLLELESGSFIGLFGPSVLGVSPQTILWPVLGLLIPFVILPDLFSALEKYERAKRSELDRSNF